MKKKIKLLGLFLGILLISAGCDMKYADTNRAIRHSGFSLSGTEFVCKGLMPEEDETILDPIRFLGSNYAITNSGAIYILSLGQYFSSEENCLKQEFSTNPPLKAVGVFNNEIVKMDNGKLFKIGAPLTEIPADDNNYTLYSLIFSDSTVVKAVTADDNLGHYYALKTDGNIYNIVISKRNGSNPQTILSTSIVYNQNDYGGKIIDFHWVGEASGSFIRTSDSIYRMVPTNATECSKYVDKPCLYTMTRDVGLSGQMDKILGYSGNLIITTYGKEFTV